MKGVWNRVGDVDMDIYSEVNKSYARFMSRALLYVSQPRPQEPLNPVQRGLTAVSGSVRGLATAPPPQQPRKPLRCGFKGIS